VLYKGKLVGIVPAGTGRHVLGLMMAGLSPEDAHADTTVTAHADTAGPHKPAQTSTSRAEGGDHD